MYIKGKEKPNQLTKKTPPNLTSFLFFQSRVKKTHYKNISTKHRQNLKLAKISSKVRKLMKFRPFQASVTPNISPFKKLCC